MENDLYKGDGVVKCSDGNSGVEKFICSLQITKTASSNKIKVSYYNINSRSVIDQTGP